MTEETPRGPQSEIKIVGYCRVCGTGLDEANVRTANGTIYCALHVPQSAPPPPPPGSPYSSPYSTPAGGPASSSEASPGAAFVLGLIPGVGAIYNGQYAKGILHIMILAMLFAGADHSSGAAEPFFALLIPGFWAYMAFEAYHTARRRKEGLAIDEFSGFDLGPRGDGRSRIPVAPILLIFFGVVFLLDNLGVLELRELLRFWPVAMIALGVYLLFARLKGEQGDQR